MNCLRLALIDDESNLVEILSYHLADQGHEVIPFSNAKTALDALKKTEVDVIITDLKMPLFSGIHLIQELSKFHKKSIPSLLLLSENDDEFSDPNEQENLKKLGFFEVLKKTQGPEKVIEVVNGYSANINSLMFA